MSSIRENRLIVIENGQLASYELDNKSVWAIGRPSKDNQPDIKLHSPTISRKHGKFVNTFGYWFYIDSYRKNGTVYNGVHIEKDKNDPVEPIFLNDKDVLIFGGGKESVINSQTVWAMFTQKSFSDKWRVEDTKNYEKIAFTDGEKIEILDKPEKGKVVPMDNGLAIYMGSVTYLNGNIKVMEI